MQRGKRKGKAEWSNIVKKFEASGLGPHQFCNQEGLSTSSFYKWLKQVRQSDPAQLQNESPFIEVKSTATSPVQFNIKDDNNWITFATPSGCSLSWPTTVSADYIAQIIGKLQ